MEREIKILHIYSKALDLYGDGSNITAIKQRLEQMGHACIIDYVELGDEINLVPYDMVYIGHGKARNLEAVADHFRSYKDSIISAIENNKIFLVTGNARELFGKSFETVKGEQKDGIGLFDYTAKETNEVIVSDEVATLTFNEDIKTYGFINRTAHLVGENKYPLFKLEKGLSDTQESGGYEGNVYKNYFGTWQMGPLLVRNPKFLKEILKRLLKDDFKDFDTTLEQKALDITLSEFNK